MRRRMHTRLEQGKLRTHNRRAIPRQVGQVKTNAIALPMCVGALVRRAACNEVFSLKPRPVDAQWGVPGLE